MFHLYTGNRLEDLAVLLERILALSPPTNPFDDEHILVQNPGMAQWLKMALAESQSIAAGFEFPLPSTFVWNTFLNVLDDIPKQSEFNKPFITWRLMRLLDTRLNEVAFQALKHYLEEDDSPVRRYQLCAAIADIYDQYLVYRPDWIKIWEAGSVDDPSLNTLFAKQPWQAILWQDLVLDISHNGHSLYHRGNLIEALEEATRSRHKPARLPGRIFIFGVSSLPPNTLEALRVLSSSGWVDIHLFLQNPCRFYWGDVVDKHFFGRVIKRQTLKPGLSADVLHLDANPLLASWGRLGRDFIAQLQDMADNEIETFEDYVQDGRSSLLHWVQQDVLTLENHGAREERDASLNEASYRHLIKRNDQSVQLHICHSPLREVEVLHDQLLNLFEQSPDLTPKDVIVMLPDVNLYSPFIKAVFGQAQGKKHIPFALIDQSGSMEDPIVDAYLYLLGIGESRFTLSELISVLEVPLVLEKFELTPTELERIRQWASEVGIRWGLNAQTAHYHNLPGQNAHTWLNGIRRMLLGYAMGHNHVWQDTLSYGEVEGLEAATAGKLAEFLAAISAVQQNLMQAMRPTEWVQTLYGVAEQFFHLEDHDFSTLLRKQLNALLQQWQYAHFDQPIEHQVVRQVLSPMLQEAQGGHRFLAGRVNFCTLMPMRSVPFNVICVLGLNEGDYPRSVPPMGFDLMAGNYRSGDRSRREDDKYLFLEALMSARETLYISYVGRSIQDNSEKNPSILVSELLEYMAQSCVFEGDETHTPDEAQKRFLAHLVTEHPLQPFNAQYFDLNAKKETRLYSYNAHWLPALAVSNRQSAPPIETPLTPWELPTDELPLEEITRFLGNPARYFTQRRLKAYLAFAQEEELEDEPFTLEGLSGYKLRDTLLEAMVKGEEQTFMDTLPLTGALPYGAFGALSLAEYQDQCQRLFDVLKGYAMEPCAPAEINITIGKLTLTAWLSLHTPTTRLSYRFGEVSANQKLQMWVEHLALCAAGNPKQHHLINLVPKTGKTLQYGFAPLLPAQAKEQIAVLLQLLQEGLTHPLPLPAKAADAWCKSYCAEKTKDDEEIAWQQALKTYQEGSGEFARNENIDPYWQRYFPLLDEQRAVFSALCERIWLPIHRCMEGLE